MTLPISISKIRWQLLVFQFRQFVEWIVLAFWVLFQTPQSAICMCKVGWSPRTLHMSQSQENLNVSIENVQYMRRMHLMSCEVEIHLEPPLENFITLKKLKEICSTPSFRISYPSEHQTELFR